jgi:antitoxin YobK
MGMAEIEQALALIQAYPEGRHFVGRRDPQLVHEAELALGVTFRPTYRRFLLELGAGSFAGEEFSGVISSDFAHSSIPDAVWLTLKLRAESELPLGIVLVHSNGYGDYYGIDASRSDAEGERPVVLWDDGLEVAAPDFGSFFLTRVRAALESEEADLEAHLRPSIGMLILARLPLTVQ